MHHLSFYVPVDHAEKVKEAIFLTGAGRVGNYDKCSWETLGTGQFRSLEGSSPFIGKVGEIERVQELKVELVCEDEYLSEAIAALINSHPYETPAYFVVKLSTLQ